MGSRQPRTSRGSDVPRAGLTDRGWAILVDALADPCVIERFRTKIVMVPGSDCWWWTGSLSGAGHGRFWISGGLVMVAHRFAYATAHGAAALEHANVLGHRCDNPLCQRIDPNHVVVSSPAQNRREWAARRLVGAGPLADPRGSKRRARVLRDLARQSPSLVAAELLRIREHGEQVPLW